MCLKPSCGLRMRVHVDSPLWARSEPTVDDSVTVTPGKLHARTQHLTAHMRRAVDTTDSRVRESLLVLRLSGHREGANPVRATELASSGGVGDRGSCHPSASARHLALDTNRTRCRSPASACPLFLARPPRRQHRCHESGDPQRRLDRSCGCLPAFSQPIVLRVQTARVARGILE